MRACEEHGKVISEKRDISKVQRRLGSNVTYQIGQWQYGNMHDRLMTNVQECGGAPLYSILETRY